MTTNSLYEITKIEGSSKKGWKVSYYEWENGKGEDCGLNRVKTFGLAEQKMMKEFVAGAVKK